MKESSVAKIVLESPGRNDLSKIMTPDVINIALTNEISRSGQSGIPISAYLLIKRVFDFICASIGILILSPLLLIVSIAVKLTSKGPVIYKQKRIGSGGREFWIYKFRTMIDGADDLEKHLSREQFEFYTYNRKIEDDPRITKLGKVLRSLSVDELPQLVNVLTGDMSLVGPRPMLPEEIEQYGDAFSEYVKTRPGITGLWQMKYRHETRMDVRAKIDKEYFRQRCLTKDMSILFSTVAVVLFKKNAY